MKYLILLHLVIIFCLSGCKVESAPTTKSAIAKTTTKPTPEIDTPIIQKTTPPIDTVSKIVDTVEVKSIVEPAVKKDAEKTETKQTNKPDKKPKKVKEQTKTLPSRNRPEIKFDEITKDFGEITEGEVVKHNFTFTNTGKSNLVIENASASCGCTIPSFPFLDIAPGETGFIGVTYNSVSKNGPQKPEITVYTNAYPKERKLYLTTTVLPKKDKEEDDQTVVEKEEVEDTTKIIKE